MDSFFPFLEEIDREVVDIEDLVFSFNNAGTDVAKVQPQKALDVAPDKVHVQLDKKPHDDEKVDPVSDKNNTDLPEISDHVRTRFFLPRPTVPIFFRHLKRTVGDAAAALSTARTRTKSPVTTMALLRMARTRRLVTSLTRLLATKSEVVTQIRKRLLTTSATTSGLGNGNGKGDDAEVAIYMGDIQGVCRSKSHVNVPADVKNLLRPYSHPATLPGPL